MLLLRNNRRVIACNGELYQVAFGRSVTDFIWSDGEKAKLLLRVRAAEIVQVSRTPE